jgi:single-stranded-DNA-specific exonuclease
MPAEKYTLRKNDGERSKDLDLKYGTLIADILINRGITNIESARRHLTGKIEEEHGDPFLIGDMEKSISRIDYAIQNNQTIAIHSDYDCDGIPGAVILSSLLNTIGYKNYIVSIPDRNTEGYGLSVDHVENLIKQNVSLIITIDLGITAIEPINLANQNNIETIVTDHHTIGSIVPNAYGIVHPKAINSTYPNKELCGAGVVYTLVRAFIEKYSSKYNIPNKFIDSVVDMAAFATLSDMVELTTENKAIVKEGLAKMRTNTRPGLMALAKAARVYMRDLTQDDITFMLAPKLNVASRMGSPYDAYNLLMEKDIELAKERAEKLTALSNERRKLVALMVKEARREIAKWSKNEKDVIVIGHPSWKVGLLGLVASKISELYDKPTFVWGRSESTKSVIYKGSCRGNGTVSVYEIMKNTDPDAILEYGGHFEAGGFSVLGDKIYDLESALVKGKKIVDENNNQITESIKHVDAVLPISLLHVNLHNALRKLAPFGPGFDEPVFLFKSVTIVDIRNFGTGNAHIEIFFRDSNSRTASAYAFYTNTGDMGSPEIGNTVHIVGTLDSKLWQDTVRVRLKDVIIPK